MRSRRFGVHGRRKGLEQEGALAAEEPSREHELELPARHLERARGDQRRGSELLARPAHDAACDLVAALGGPKDGRRGAA